MLASLETISQDTSTLRLGSPDEELFLGVLLGNHLLEHRNRENA
ncbi:MAG: hypothetical protein RMI91_05195 [Gemmatales bacterium]|nr:hypothetical protein [Gemmatales bacterium]MDW7994031.1 hypothetical protein [Gemmatales bacterium]